MAAGTTKQAFTAEVQALLDLMIHSLYSHKEIFLRELISNASDALDRRRFLGLTEPGVLPKGELEIRLDLDRERRTLDITDNGIGMSRDDLVQQIGTIARSGTKEFLSAIKARRAEGGAVPPELIGQFGVGFYSSFMVAKKVTIITRRVGEATASKWESTGDGTYSIDEATRDDAGTTVTLELKPEDFEDGIQNYVDPATVKEIVKRHSDFVAYPIRMRGAVTSEVLDKDGKATTHAQDEVLNSMKAIWTRPKSEVKDEEYTEFYRHVSHDWGEPAEVIAAQLEGKFSARALLFLPAKAPFDLFQRGGVSRGLLLYVKRVLIIEDCHDLLPDWLRFVKGVVDAEDLSLNVSREMLQQDRQVRAIQRFLVKKVLDTLAEMKKERADKYKKLLDEFNVVLKEGLTTMSEQRERLLDLVSFTSSRDPATPTCLDDYVERMKPAQAGIYYLSGPSLTVVQGSPHLEAFKAKGVEVLYLTDPVDEFWLQSVTEYKGKPLVSVAKGELDLTSIENKEAAETKLGELEIEHYKELCAALKKHLSDNVKEVRLSGRLTKSPACLVGEAYDLSPQMEEMMRRMGQAVPKQQRVLEINRDHPFIEKLRTLQATRPDDPALKSFADLLWAQAVIAEGGHLRDPAAFAGQLVEVMTKALPL